MSKTFSGREVIKILRKDFDFSFVSQKGSHVKLRKIIRGRKITAIIPLHKELAPGTLRGVLDLAEIDLEEFLNIEKRA
jgi:predicted RNA binding protein YcfA (HicA-like mRNA interferase family)